MTGAPHLPTDGGFKSHGFGRQDEVVASPRLAPLATTVPGRPWRRSKTASRGRSPGGTGKGRRELPRCRRSRSKARIP